MSRIIFVDDQRCVGCRTCEMVCSLGHENMVDPYHSRIKVIRREDIGRFLPLNCRQCESAPCLIVCPTGAISRDGGMNRTVIQEKRCIGCRSCVFVCPFGAMAFNTVRGKVYKCDLCDGEPLCVQFCAYDALAFVEADELHQDRLQNLGESYFHSRQKDPDDSQAIHDSHEKGMDVS